MRTTLIDGRPPRNAAPSLEELRARRADILAACTRNRATNVWVFGSVARGESDGLSDLDLAVEFERGASLLDVAGLVCDLEDLLGCPVDVADLAALRDNRFGRRVRREMAPL